MAGERSPDQDTACGPYEGLRVVGLEQAVAAPFATRQLADMGAEVIKVERPDGGDFARHYDQSANGVSAYFAWLNVNKRSVVLDLASAEGKDALAGLLSTADVFVHNLGPGAVERLGFGRESVAARYPNVINCQISGFGIDGPYAPHKAYDMLIQQESGVPSITGSADLPAKVGASIADIGAGLYAYASIQAALAMRSQIGRGQFLDISMFECLTEWMSPPLLTYLGTGRVLERQGVRHNMLVPYGSYACADGSVNLATQNNREWNALRAALGIADRPQYATNEMRLANRRELEAELEAAIAHSNREDVIARLDAHGVPWGHVNDVPAVAEHPQLTARRRWQEYAHEHGSFQGLRPPHNLEHFERVGGRAPALGEHTEAVLAELDAAGLDRMAESPRVGLEPS